MIREADLILLFLVGGFGLAGKDAENHEAIHYIM